MKVMLELQDQPSNIRKVTIRHDIVIGRGAECNLRLSAPQVSRRHCFLRIGTDGAYISDLDSSNGTYLAGKRLSSGKRYTLNDGAILAVGPVRFVASVHPEVAADEALKVHVADHRIEIEAEAEAEAGLAVDDSSNDVNFVAAMPDTPGEHPDDDHSALNFAIEQGGATADEDEPTTDYVPGDGIEGPVLAAEDELLPGLPDLKDMNEPETVAAANGIMNSADDEIIELGVHDIDVLEDNCTAGDEESDLKNFLQGLD